MPDKIKVPNPALVRVVPLIFPERVPDPVELVTVKLLNPSIDISPAPLIAPAVTPVLLLIITTLNTRFLLESVIAASMNILLYADSVRVLSPLGPLVGVVIGALTVIFPVPVVVVQETLVPMQE